MASLKNKTASPQREKNGHKTTSPQREKNGHKTTSPQREKNGHKIASPQRVKNGHKENKEHTMATSKERLKKERSEHIPNGEHIERITEQTACKENHVIQTNSTKSKNGQLKSSEVKIFIFV